MAELIPARGRRFGRECWPWEPARLEESVLEARGHRWTIQVATVVSSDACYWAHFVVRAGRTYDLLLRISPLATLHGILVALERWLNCGDQPVAGVRIHTSNEVPAMILH
jgi:hypothetical protein